MRNRLTSAVAFAFALATPVAASNIVVNPNFDADLITGWSGMTRTAWDITRDFGGNPGVNGSALSTLPGTFGDSYSQCLGVTASTLYSFGAKVLVSTLHCLGQVAIIWFSSVNCSGAPLRNDIGSGASSPGIWADSLPLLGNPVLSPGTAQSATVILVTQNDDQTVGNPDGTVNIDNVFFGPGTFPVALVGFSAE